MEELGSCIDFLLGDECIPPLLQGDLIGGNGPNASRHNAKSHVAQNFFDCDKISPATGVLRQKWISPVFPACAPFRARKTYRAQFDKLLVPVGFAESAISYSRRFRWIIGRCSQCKNDTHRVLYALEYPARNWWQQAFGGAVNYPDIVAVATEIRPHFLEAGAVQKSCYGYVADYPRELFFNRRLFITSTDALLKNFPRGPAPEIDVEIAQVFCVCCSTTAVGLWL